jgi:hypothetical protein
MSASSPEPFLGDVEALLRQALAPVEPPEDFLVAFETSLADINQAAQDELAAWELEAMADPRNWVRPVVAVAAGGIAGAGLVVLRVQATRRRRRSQSQDPLDYAVRTVRALGAETKRLLRD